MITLYKQIETKGLYYKEMWYEKLDMLELLRKQV